MIWQFLPSPIATLYFVTAIIVTLVGVVMLRYQPVLFSRRALVAFFFAVAFWQFAYALQLAGSTEATVLFWERFKFAGLLAAVPLWFLFVWHEYAPVAGWHPLSRRQVWALGLPAVVSLLVVFTNDWHHLYWVEIVPDVSVLPAEFMSVIGPAFPVVVCYYLIVMLMGVFSLFVARTRTVGSKRVVTGLLLAWTATGTIHVLDMLHLFRPIFPANVASLVYGLTGLFTFWVLFRHRVMDLVPVARSQVVESMQDGVIVLDADNRVVDCNPAAETLLEVNARQAIGKPGEEALRRLPEAAVPYTGNQRAQAEVPFMREGKRLILSLGLTPLHDPDGHYSGRVVTLRDVTDQRQAENLMRTALARTHALYRGSSLLVTLEDLTDLLHNVTYAVQEALSAYWVNVLGVNLEEMRITHLVSAGEGAGLITMPSLEELMDGLIGYALQSHDVIFSPRSLLPDFRQSKAMQERRAADGLGAMIVAPLHYKDQLFGALTVANHLDGRDLTPQDMDLVQALAAQASAAISNARLLEQVQEYADELEIRNRELDAFSHTVAHDLKKPLTYVVGYADLLREDERIPPDAVDFLDRIYNAGRKMDSMIEGLLLLAHLRNAEGVIEAVILEPVVQSVRTRFGHDLQERGITLHVQPDLPAVMGYADWLEEALANLLSNAIKYIGKDNPDPRITIGAEQVEPGVIRITVGDNGVGISEADRAKLFELFTRFHQSEASGHGLGLSIVQQIVTRLGGQIGVDSEPGQGSTFWILLPAVAEETPAAD